MGQGATRREWLGRTASIAGGAGAAALLGAGSAAAVPPPADGHLLHQLLISEKLAVYCYEQAQGSGLLTPRAARVVELVLRQEHAHVRVLSHALRATGGTPPHGPHSVAEADHQLSVRKVPQQLAHLSGSDDARRLLIALEGVLEGSYVFAIGALRASGLVRAACSIMADEAQHELLLRLLAHGNDPKKAVPSGLIVGTLPKDLTGSLG